MLCPFKKREAHAICEAESKVLHFPRTQNYAETLWEVLPKRFVYLNFSNLRNSACQKPNGFFCPTFYCQPFLPETACNYSAQAR